MEDALLLNCTLHNLNLEGSVPFKKVLVCVNSGVGPDKHTDRDVEQFMFTAFRFEDFLDKEVREALWHAIRDYAFAGVAGDEEGEEAAAEQFIGVGGDEEREGATTEQLKLVAAFKELDGSRYISSKRGSDSRWWSIGEAATLLLKTLPIRKAMAENFDKLRQTGAARDTCQTLLSFFNEQQIICDLALLKCHHRFYLARHMQYFQLPDHLTRKSGFQAFNVLSRVFLMQEDYKTMREDQSLPEFEDLRKEISILPDEQQRSKKKKQVDDFLRYGLAENIKMFGLRWTHPDNVFLACFGEHETSRPVCQRLLDLPFCVNRRKTQFNAILGKWESADGDDGQYFCDDACAATALFNLSQGY
jgi:hypothetical protein